LPRARMEATLAALHGRGTPLLGNDATLSRLRAESPQKRVLHIAAHAVLGAMGDPMASAILLSREPGPDGQTGAGRLSVGDLIATWGDRLKGCELAVLSCCQTGRGVQVGDSVMALPIGFVHAGVACLVATLWKVDDLATCLGMVRFHQNYWGVHKDEKGMPDIAGRKVWGTQYQPGEVMPIPQALADAKRWVREMTVKQLVIIVKSVLLELEDSTDRIKESAYLQRLTNEFGLDGHPFSHPHHWAAFTIIGDVSTTGSQRAGRGGS